MAAPRSETPHLLVEGDVGKRATKDGSASDEYCGQQNQSCVDDVGACRQVATAALPSGANIFLIRSAKHRDRVTTFDKRGLPPTLFDHVAVLVADGTVERPRRDDNTHE